MSGSYYIISQLNNALVLDIQGASKSPGTPVITYNKNRGDNQKWYDDRANHTIRSCLNGFCMDIEGGRLVVNPFKQGKRSQQWERKGNLIMSHSDPHMVLDISGKNSCSGATVISYEMNNQWNQLWTFEVA